MNSLKVSIIIPCFNQAQYLEESCTSIKNQTHSNWEVLIINDGSTDDTEKIALDICKKDNRFLYFSKPNGGLSSARNYGLDHFSGDYVQFLDSDDLISPTKLEVSIRENSDLVVTDFQLLEKGKVLPPFCDLKNQKIDFNNVLKNWDIEFSIPIHAGLFKKNILEGIRFNEQLKAKEDWFFWLEILEKNPKTSFVNKPLCLYRLHQNNMCKDDFHMLENIKLVYKLLFDKFKSEHVKKELHNRLNNALYLDNKNLIKTQSKYRKYKALTNKLIVLSSLLLVIVLYLMFSN